MPSRCLKYNEVTVFSSSDGLRSCMSAKLSHLGSVGGRFPALSERVEGSRAAAESDGIGTSKTRRPERTISATTVAGGRGAEGREELERCIRVL